MMIFQQLSLAFGASAAIYHQSKEEYVEGGLYLKLSTEAIADLFLFCNYHTSTSLE